MALGVCSGDLNQDQGMIVLKLLNYYLMSMERYFPLL